LLAQATAVKLVKVKRSGECLSGEANGAIGETSLALPVTIEVPSQEDIWSAASLNGQFSISYADDFAPHSLRSTGVRLSPGTLSFA
jgi:hypothetical protein